MTSSVYQATVEELEALLSPRVVSRSLQEGLKLVGKSPDSVDLTDLEKILKAQVYRQLQVAMPVSEAKTRINDILNKLKSLEEEQVRNTSSKQDLSAQAHALADLKEKLKPFNLYFEWPEVQKLRAQINLLEAEQAGKRTADKLVLDAREQFKLVEQKLEGELVAQDKELVELEHALEAVKTLGGPKVRRLEALVGQIRDSQNSRQLAQGELERARKLALDLRKLMQSTVISQEVPALLPEANPVVQKPIATPQPSQPQVASHPVSSHPVSSHPNVTSTIEEEGLLEVESGVEDLLSIDTSQLSPDVSAKLLELDVESERRDLDLLEKEFTQLLAYRPELAELLNETRTSLNNKTSVASRLTELRDMFSAAVVSEREALKQTLKAIEQDLLQLGSDVDITELAQALQVTLGIAEISLPAKPDVQHVHSLYHIAKERQREAAIQRRSEESVREQKYQQQQQALDGFNKTFAQYKGETLPEYTHFSQALAMLQEAHDAYVILPDQISVIRQAQARLESGVAERLGSGSEKQRAKIRALLGELQNLPVLSSLQSSADSVKNVLETHLSELQTTLLPDEALGSASSLLANLKERLGSAYRDQLMALVQRAMNVKATDVLGDLQRAGQALEWGRYPDLGAIERSLSKATEKQRGEQLNDLHDLETELGKYQTIGGESLTSLSSFISDARGRLEKGSLIDNLEDAWGMVELLRSDVERRSQSFIPRLDIALQKLEKVSKLNSEEVGSVSRMLQHLNGQRTAFGKVSATVQYELEKSLSEAEAIVRALDEQYEATRAIAGQLVTSSALDDFFGVFDGEEKSTTTFAPEEPTETVFSVQSKHQNLNDWSASYAGERGVRGVAVFSLKGEMVVGQVDVPAEQLQTSLSEVSLHLATLGQELSLGRQLLMTLEMFNHTVVAAWPTPQHYLLVIINDPSALSLVLHKLRRDLPTVGSWLASTAVVS
jgi:chromosome segregation protein